MGLVMVQDADVRTAHLAVEERLLLRASAPWVACPAALLLPFKGRTFEFQARPQAPAEGLKMQVVPVAENERLSASAP